MRRAKAFLWHGSAHTALEVLDDLTWDVDTESEAAKAFQNRLEEFMDYITANTAAPQRLAAEHPLWTALPHASRTRAAIASLATVVRGNVVVT